MAATKLKFPVLKKIEYIDLSDIVSTRELTKLHGEKKLKVALIILALTMKELKMGYTVGLLDEKESDTYCLDFVKYFDLDI